MKVKEWLPDFLDGHHARHRRDDWPHPSDAVYCRLWLDALLSLDPKPKQFEAERASRVVDGSAIDRPEDHPFTVLKAIQIAREEKPVSKPESAPSKNDLAVMSAEETHKASQLNMWERVERAGEIIDEYHELGWIMAWNEMTGRFYAIGGNADPRPIPQRLWCRMWAVRAEVYWLLGHPLPGWLPPIEISDLKPTDWREMVARLAERAEVVR